MYKPNPKQKKHGAFRYVKFTSQLSFKTNFLKVEQHTADKWLIHGAKHHKDN